LRLSRRRPRVRVAVDPSNTCYFKYLHGSVSPRTSGGNAGGRDRESESFAKTSVKRDSRHATSVRTPRTNTAFFAVSVAPSVARSDAVLPAKSCEGELPLQPHRRDVDRGQRTRLGRFAEAAGDDYAKMTAARTRGNLMNAATARAAKAITPVRATTPTATMMMVPVTRGQATP
jgi:hypothetical protein